MSCMLYDFNIIEYDVNKYADTMIQIYLDTWQRAPVG